jgi:hypothetical protein
MYRSPKGKKSKLAQYTHCNVRQRTIGSIRPSTEHTRVGNAGRGVDRAPGAEVFESQPVLVPSGAQTSAENVPQPEDWSPEPTSQIHFSLERVSVHPAPAPSTSLDADEGLRWDRERSNLQTQYISNLVANSQFIRQQSDALQSAVSARIAAAAQECPNCCTSRAALSLRRTVSVLWVGISFRFTLDVPINVCQGCCQQTTVYPLQVGCFPGTPVYHQDLTTTPAGVQPIWFDLTLLKVGTACTRSLC